MAFFSSAIDTLQTLVIALGAGLGVWGVVNLLEGYLLFSVACFFTVHEHWSPGYPSRSPPAD